MSCTTMAATCTYLLIKDLDGRLCTSARGACCCHLVTLSVSLRLVDGLGLRAAAGSSIEHTKI